MTEGREQVRARVLELAAREGLAPGRLTPPRSKVELLPRASFEARLDAGARQTLTTVIAPAGYGKSSAVASWARTQAPTLAWLRVSEDARAPWRLLTALLAAVALARPELCPGSWPEPGPVDLRRWLTRRLLLPLARNGGQLSVVIDEAERARASVWTLVEALVREAEPGLRLIVISREPGPDFLARLAAEGALLELGVDDLRLTQEEQLALARSVLGRAPSAHERAWLLERGQGWPVATRLLARGLRGRPADEALPSAGMRDRQALRYVLDEVIDRLPSTSQRALLATAIVDELEPEICAALAGTNLPALWELLDAGLVSEGAGHWRHHPLVRAALLARLADGPDRARLHAVAARHYFARSQLELGLHHAAAAGDHERVAAEVATHIWPTLRSGAFVRLRELLAHVTPATEASLPELLAAKLALGRAWAGLAGPPQAALPALEQARARLQRLDASADANARALETSLQVLELLLQLRGGATEARAPLQALELDGLEAPARRGLGVVVGLSCALAAELAVELEPAAAALAQAYALAHAEPPLRSLTTIAGHRVRVAHRRARVHEARELAQRAHAQLCAQGWEELPATGLLELEWALVELDRGDAEQAEALALRGLAKLELGGDGVAHLRGLVALARVRRARGDLGGVHDALEAARAQLELLPIPWLRALVELEADPFAPALEAGAPPGPLHGRIQTELRLARARRWLCAPEHASRRDAVLRELELELREASASGRALDELVAKLLLAAMLDARDPERSAALIAEASARAETQSLRGLFLVLEPRARPAWLRDPAAANARTRSELPLADPLNPRGLGEATSRAGSRIAEGRSQLVVADPLSPRELEVLARVAEGLSNKLVASDLHISLATVKTHMHHIFTKLEVRNRTQAVHRARALGWIA